MQNNNWPLTQYLTAQDFADEKDIDEDESLVSAVEGQESQQVLDAQPEEGKKVITIALPPVFADTPIRPRFDLSRPFR